MVQGVPTLYHTAFSWLGSMPRYLRPVDPVVVNDLQPDDVQVARRIIATAFAGEPFAVAMFGDSPLARFVGMQEQYRSWPSDPAPVAVVARAGSEVVGVAQGTRPGQCQSV